MGASLGGLISLYTFFRQPTIFGFAGVLSPSLHFANTVILDYINQRDFVPGKIFLSVGNQELTITRTKSQHIVREEFVNNVRKLRQLLAHKGYSTASLRYLEVANGEHNELQWGRVVREAIRFFLDRETEDF